MRGMLVRQPGDPVVHLLTYGDLPRIADDIDSGRDRLWYSDCEDFCKWEIVRRGMHMRLVTCLRCLAVTPE